MMGAGKSAVGRALAARLERGFVDSDVEIEKAAGASVREIFEREGEQGFRARERAAIDALAGQPLVVALGGGAIAQPGAPEKLAQTGTVVWLRASPDTLAGRIGDAETRPLLRGLDPAARTARLAELLAARAPAYASARIAVDTDRLAVAGVVDAVLERL
jgi:shikimate kinase